MLKRNWFYICLIIIYLCYLGKDTFFKLIDNREEINNYACEIKNEQLLEEYQKISKLLDIPTYENNIIYSKILIHDIYEFFDKITISKGSNDGIKKGDIVINEQGLIGIINKVDKNSSEVYLITNNNTNISVKVNDSYGILYSKDNMLYVKNIKLDKEIKIGDIVTTSGLTNIPEGIKIGTVSKVNKDNLGLEYVLDITNNIDLKHVKYVGVMTR